MKLLLSLLEHRIFEGKQETFARQQELIEKLPSDWDVKVVSVDKLEVKKDQRTIEVSIYPAKSGPSSSGGYIQTDKPKLGITTDNNLTDKLIETVNLLELYELLAKKKQFFEFSFELEYDMIALHFDKSSGLTFKVTYDRGLYMTGVSSEEELVEEFKSAKDAARFCVKVKEDEDGSFVWW